MKGFWRWLWSEYYSGTAKCRYCGAVDNKTSMYHDSIYGWFCSKNEFEDYWMASQLL